MTTTNRTRLYLANSHAIFDHDMSRRRHVPQNFTRTSAMKAQYTISLGSVYVHGVMR